MIEPEDDATRLWWESLSEADQQDLRRRWDARSEELSRVAPTEANEPWRRLPIHLVGHFVDPEDAVDERLMSQQLLEFILNHEDVRFFLAEREYHICRQHPPAHQILRERRLPADFRCPKRGADCPMRRISDAVAGLELRIRLG